MVQTAEQAIERLYGIGVDSYNRMETCLNLMNDLPRRDAYRALGAAWTCSDNIAKYNDILLEWLASADRGDLDAMMKPEDVNQLRAMPDRFTVWRGCYEFNIHGFSWSLDREIAARFPTLTRYRRPTHQPLLVEAEVDRDCVALLTDRHEDEIIAINPRIVSVTPL